MSRAIQRCVECGKLEDGFTGPADQYVCAACFFGNAPAPSPERPTPPPCPWRPIETAPKDGTEVLLTGLGWKGARWMTVAHWHKGWQDGEGPGELDPKRITHWMPLPEPPATYAWATHEDGGAP